MWLNLLGMGVKTAAKLYQDKQKTKEDVQAGSLQAYSLRYRRD